MTEGRVIDYEGLAQDALRGVVRTVLARAAKNGLPGDHHFYVSFHTQAPGVTLSKRLREKYPREMTIVLQHRFWDLSVTDDRFDVKLTFDGIPERIIVPFAAVKVFFDPSVRYGIQFEDPDGDPDAAGDLGAPLNFDSEELESGTHAGPDERRPPGQTTVRSAVPRRPRVVKKARNDKGPEAPVAPLPSPIGRPAPRPEPPHPSSQSPEDAHASDLPPASEKSGGAEIVRLDMFRKK